MVRLRALILPQVRPQAGPEEGLTKRGMDISWVLSVCQLRAITGCGPLNGMALYGRPVNNELADIRKPEKSGYPLLVGAFEVASLRDFLLRELMGGQTGQPVRKDNA